MAMIVAVAVAPALGDAPAYADVFHLKTGAIVEGDLIDALGDKVRVMLTNGAVILAKEDIAQHETSPTTLQRHEAEKNKRAGTAQGEYDLGVWCDQNGLPAEARAHYRAAISKDPTLTAAYRALGYVAVGDAWLDGSPSVPRPKATTRPAKIEQPLIDEIITGWCRRLYAVRYATLEPPSDRDESKYADGRGRILLITDPLAIPAMARVLSEGSGRTRRLLVEAIGRFPQEEATLNLLAMTLLDPDPLVRSDAAAALVPRKDPRIEATLRKALKTNDEDLMRRAASALGVLKARSAVGDLILLLASNTPAPSPKAQEVFLVAMARTFNKPTAVELGGRTLQHVPAIAIPDNRAAAPAGTTRPAARGAGLTNRVEVQEALTAITGENFRFDVGAWRRWEKQHPTTRP